MAGSERFEEIARKWSEHRGHRVPQPLQQLLIEQRAACDAMLEEKGRLIGEFQEELKARDEHYVRHLKREAEDVDLVLERMEEQTRSLMQTYREELGEIEQAFDAERRGVLESQQAARGESTGQRAEREREYLQERERRIDENEAQLQHLRVRNMEEFNRIKTKLETDIQVLQQQIQQMKATFQLNAEKLEYNFQVSLGTVDQHWCCWLHGHCFSRQCTSTAQPGSCSVSPGGSISGRGKDNTLHAMP